MQTKNSKEIWETNTDGKKYVMYNQDYIFLTIEI